MNNIQNCNLNDTDAILQLYQAARNLQTQRQMVVWPHFDPAFIETEIRENRQWKLLADDGTIACNWAVTFADKEIWGERDLSDAIYIHRLCTNPQLRGNRFVETMVQWATSYARQLGKPYVRLDTLGNNTGLIKHYTSAGFTFLGIHRLTDTTTLPQHYQNEPNCCLFELAV
jgi:ribosomal protein S18 acetylase RimI-like enzyme